jgi:hypothetical protein
LFATDESTGTTLSITPDRAVGGGVLSDGLATLLLHRRLTMDDNLGVGEVLTEPGLDSWGTGLVIRTLHRVSVHSSVGPAAVARRHRLAHADNAPVLYFRESSDTPLPPPQGAWRTLWSALNPSALPALHNAQLLSVASWGGGQLLLRVSHSFESGEGGAAGTPIAGVTLSSIFNATSSGITLQSCEEMTATGNQPLDAAQQWSYSVLGGESVTLPVVPAPPSGENGLGEFTLNPLAIRTFLCQAQLAGGSPFVLE